jgi:ATP-binding protein involved in chromosome partitioning
MPIPVEIVGVGRREVTFVWDEDHEGVYPARDLRLRCRCANCIHELTGERLLDPGTVAADLRVTRMELQGNYGVRIEFSDRHATGIYRFADLLARCPCPRCASGGMVRPVK